MPTSNLFTPAGGPSGYRPIEPPTRIVPAVRPRRRRNAALGAALAGLLLVAGLVVALLMPGGEPAPTAGPDYRSGVGQLAVGADLPADGPAAERPGAGARRALGDDTLLAGRIVANNGGTLVVAQDGGAERTVRTDDRSRIRGGGNRAVTDLQAGERVLVRVTGTGDAAVAVAVVARLPRLLGTVTAVNGDTATLVRVDGRTEDVNVAKLAPEPAVGELVALVGSAVDGGTFTADRVRVLPRTS